MNWVEAISWFAFVCAFLLLVISYTPVENGERGDVKRFGKLIRVLPPGFNFVVPFLDKVKINSTKTIQREFPGNPEQVEGHDARRRADQLKPTASRMSGKPRKLGKSPRAKARPGTSPLSQARL